MPTAAPPARLRGSPYPRGGAASIRAAEIEGRCRARVSPLGSGAVRTFSSAILGDGFLRDRQKLASVPFCRGPDFYWVFPYPAPQGRKLLEGPRGLKSTICAFRPPTCLRSSAGPDQKFIEHFPSPLPPERT